MICRNCNWEIGDAAVCPNCGAKALNKPLPHHLPTGTVIGGRYKVEGVLGEGGFGITYLTRDTKLGLSFAVKEYFPHGMSFRNTTGTGEVYVTSEDAEAIFNHGKERFLDEARTLVKFNAEPGVVKVIDFVEENNTVYLVMEYLEGVTLQEYLREHGKMDAYEAFTMLEPVMRTLEQIHQAGVIHRDISPDNIMRLNNGQLKLMDFGAAKEFVDESRSMSVMLKKGYAPEEQYRRNGKQGQWTDVYALCATLYRCIVGRAPLDSLDRLVEDTLLPPSQTGVRIHPEAERLLMYGLEVRQQDRCQSVTSFLRRWEYIKPAVKAASENDGTILADRTDLEDETVIADPVISQDRINPVKPHEEYIHTDLLKNSQRINVKLKRLRIERDYLVEKLIRYRKFTYGILAAAETALLVILLIPGLASGLKGFIFIMMIALAVGLLAYQSSINQVIKESGWQPGRSPSVLGNPEYARKYLGSNDLKCKRALKQVTADINASVKELERLNTQIKELGY